MDVTDVNHIATFEKQILRKINNPSDWQMVHIILETIEHLIIGRNVIKFLKAWRIRLDTRKGCQIKDLREKPSRNSHMGSELRAEKMGRCSNRWTQWDEHAKLMALSNGSWNLEEDSCGTKGPPRTVLLRMEKKQTGRYIRYKINQEVAGAKWRPGLICFTFAIKTKYYDRESIYKNISHRYIHI